MSSSFSLCQVQLHLLHLKRESGLLHEVAVCSALLHAVNWEYFGFSELSPSHPV